MLTFSSSSSSFYSSHSLQCSISPFIFAIYSDFQPPAMAMPSTNPTTSFLFFCLLFTLLISALCRSTGFAGQVTDRSSFFPPRKDVAGNGKEMARSGITRGELIGSTAPICTYNECRGCRFKCSAEQVPVDAGDPMNSAYRYRCVCHSFEPM
ncbi:EPIDERMAL PATTERNING FACTOR-like protein 9 [Zingiber officinale]|uniref:EPIDERMAL PATTERNING FACTOR-like protein 9 n=1 Tax=Zingiber officinale TaxID=94328 RepID=UPI001C4D245C|nr:EPIDERMAL PATTERNING FACTOR-like protein 9 [Zingiber officinale]XP_042434863.1 EPIDERMAL PATTERNING FACTOR-like protein 9 [Zingiber officinale]